MLDSQNKKIEMLKNKIQEARKSDDSKDASNSGAAALAQVILYVLRIIIFYYAVNIVLDKFKFETFSFLECFLIFVAIVGVGREVSRK
jgi:hypothetical protein